MILNILLVTQYRWDSRKKKNNVIKNILMLCPDIKDVKITMQYKNLGKPDTYTNSKGKVRIKESWFEKHISNQAKADGYTHAGFIFSTEDGNRWGIARGHRGTNFRDGDFFGEFWVKTNERSIRTYNNGRRNLYEVVVPHEIGHEITRQNLTKLEVHDFDYKSVINNIEGFYSKLKINPQSELDVLFNRTIGIIRIKIMKLKNFLWKRATYPVPNFKTGVTQAWGVRNPLYKSGIHNGTDFRAPKGTPVKAMYHGMVYLSGKSKELGNYCFFESYIDNRLRWFLFPHLSYVPKVQFYLKGDTIGYVGNTGLSFGSHFHVTSYNQKPLSLKHHVDLVNTEQKVMNNTRDFYKEMRWLVDHKII